MDTNSNPSGPAKRSLVVRIFRWLFLIVGAAATLAVGCFAIPFCRLLLHENISPRAPEEWVILVLIHLLAIAFLLYLRPWRFWRWLFSWRTARRALIGLAVLSTLIAVFYAEENWRGKRAWEQCKRDLEAKGEVLDWSAYIPAPIPDDENIIKAPKMTEWFVRPRLNMGGSNEPTAKLDRSTLSELVKRNQAADPILVARLVLAPANSSATNGADAVIRFDIPGAKERLGKFVQDAVGPSANASEGFASFVRQPLSQIKPVRILLQTDQQLSAADLSQAFPAGLVSTNIGVLRVGNDADRSAFRVLLAAKPTLSAAEYLAWSDKLLPEVHLIREALKRPRIRMDDNYQRPFEIPMVNFVAIRNMAQTAAQRAQCCLLLGRSEQAFRELSLIYEMRRLLAAKPTTLVAAMIDVAITGLYAETIADGLRLQAWREPELGALQQQLQQVNLLPPVIESFRGERAAVCRTLETSSARQIRELFSFGNPPTSLWERFTNPTFLLPKFGPRGWLDQNLAVLATVKQTAIEAYDVERRIIKPGVPKAANREIQRMADHRSPYNFFAAIALPNFARATQTTLRNQTKVNQALVVCGLERYRLAHGGYPESLNALVPQFVEKLPHDVIGGQPLTYRRTDDGQFVLYSVGWNETDDGGVVGLRESGTVDINKGDWVWRYPSK